MRLAFRLHVIDVGLEGRSYGQTTLADLDNCGRPEFITGRSGGPVYWYKYQAPDRWTRHLLGEQSASDVGGAALDVDGDGWIDFVTGGAWYRNSREPDTPFERIVFDPQLNAVRDVAVGDIDGDGRPDIVTMSDRNTLRWYRIPDNPRAPWAKQDIGPPVHAGLSLGDLDRDGDFNILPCEMEAVAGEWPPRWYIWENLDGKGGAWQEHMILDANLGGHEAVVGEVTGNGLWDVISKPWAPGKANAVGGRMFVVFLENVSAPR